MNHFLDQENNFFKAIGFTIEDEGDVVHLHFHFQEKLNDVQGLPQETIKLNAPDVMREKELWKDTCFELFIRQASDTSEYFEINFSPVKRKWNAFYFSTYRSPVQETDKIAFIQSSISPSIVSLSFKPPFEDCIYHPKVVLFRPKDQSFIYLSDFQHPEKGPDFHIFPAT